MQVRDCTYERVETRVLVRAEGDRIGESGDYPVEAVEPGGVEVPEQRLGVGGEHVVEVAPAVLGSLPLLDAAPHLHQLLLPLLRETTAASENLSTERKPPTGANPGRRGERDLEAAGLDAVGDEVRGDAAEYPVGVRRRLPLPLRSHRDLGFASPFPGF